jgi:uncharacterized membrane protein YhaH (DUF805 family)
MGSTFFSFSGRLGRARYWLALLVTMLVWTAGMFVALILRGAIGADTGLTVAAVTGFGAFAFGSLIGIAAGVKRLHDRGKSGWWLLPFYGVPGFLYGFFSITMLDGLDPIIIYASGVAAPLVLSGMTAWAVVELGCLKGTTGPNAYGPDPLPSAAGGARATTAK